MTNNLMQQYVDNTKIFLNDFTKLFLLDEYNKEISSEYINSYIESRLYNYGDSSQKFFYKRIFEALTEKKEELEEKFEKEYYTTLEKNLEMYQLVFYVDGVRPVNDYQELLNQIYEKIGTEKELKPLKNIENKIAKLVKEYIEEKEIFLESLSTKDFSLDIEKYILIDNAYKVKLNYNFKLPYIYSSKVIDEVYNEGTINEDKLIIEYMLLVGECIKDINKGDFDRKYLVDFAKSLYGKDKKIKQTLRVLNNVAIQDKVFLKIEYKDFLLNKDLIYELMQDGFKFSIIIDDSFEVTDANLRMLNMFKYMLVPKNNRNYEEIKDRETIINNVIIYDL